MAIMSVGLIEPVLQFEDGNGVPYAGGSISFYVVGTGTLQDVYSDAALTTPLTNPVTLNAAGRTSTSAVGVDTPVYLQQKTYDYTLKDSSGVTVFGPITVAGSQWPGQIQSTSTLSPAANANGYTNRLSTTINKASSGVHALFAGTRFDIPTIGAGASTLTEASTVYIEGAPATGTNQYALHVAAGTSRFDGPISTAQAVPGTTHACDFRLSLTTAVPVTTSDVTAATTIYCEPYAGNYIALYSGTAWMMYSSAEFSIAVPSTTATMYDVFCYASGTTPTLELTAWTNTTTRATALTTQDGILVKSGVTTRRYLGSFLTTGVSGQTEDSAHSRYLFSYVNIVPKPVYYPIATDNWDYTTATIRQANADTANQINIVQGWAERPITVSYRSHNKNTNADVQRLIAIGEDSTTAFTGTSDFQAPSRTGIMAQLATLAKVPAVGQHKYCALEYSAATGTTTWYGDNGAPTLLQSGMFGTWWC